MPSHTTAAVHHELLHTIEPLFIEHFKATYGASPSLTELKQHLVHTGIEDIVNHINTLNTRVTEFYTHSEISNTISLYLRRMK